MRCKKFIDTDCLTEARKRIRHIYDIFDTVAVCFSGGKDSLVTLHLIKEVAEELGRLPVDCVFRDEELIPASVVDFVDRYRQQPWCRLRWYAVPLASTKYVLGVCKDYVQWDPARPWIRQPPPWSIRLPEGDNRVFDQFTADDFIANEAQYKGKVAFVTGIRASESIIRFRSCVNKLHDNYIVATDSRRVMLAKPIYDWQENDVFKFLHDSDIPYCPAYDHQLFAGQNLRVSTPLHAESAKRFHKLRTIDPQFYEQVIQVFPEMLAHERYYRDLDRSAVVKQYGQSVDGVRAWITENFHDEDKLKLALYRLKSAAGRADQSAYPPDYLLKCFMSGAFKREILPQRC